MDLTGVVVKHSSLVLLAALGITAVLGAPGCGGSARRNGGPAPAGEGGGGAAPSLQRCPSCSDDEACCLETGKCYSPSRAPEACPAPSNEAGHAGAPEVPLVPVERRCASNAHCEADEFCRPDSDASACLGAGYCVARDCKLDCRDDAMCERAVCGCDGTTYATEAAACEAGVRVATTSACGEPVPGTDSGSPVIGCGSSADCPDGYGCCEITGRCYEADCVGCCAATPEGTLGPCERDEHCSAGQYCAGEGCNRPGGCVWHGSAADCGGELVEVCGCDGQTYTNECWARAAGTRVAAKGGCR